MKKIYLLFICACICSYLTAQPLPDSVKIIFKVAKTDMERGKILNRYFDINIDSDTLINNLIALRQFFEEKKQPGLVDYVGLGICRQLSRASEYTEAINELFQLLNRFENRKDDYGVMICNRNLSYAYYAAGDKDKTLYHDQRTVDLSIAFGANYDLAFAYNNIAADLAEYGHFDSASIYAHKAVKISKEINDPILISKTLGTLGEYYLAIKQYDSACKYMREALPIAIVHSKLDLAFGFNDFSQMYQGTNQIDSAIYFADKGAVFSKQIALKSQLLRSYKYLSSLYKQKGPIDSAYKYLNLTIITNDSIFSAEKTKQLQVINLREQNRQREIEQQKLDLQNKIKIYALIAGLIIFTFIGFILYINSRKEKNAKILLQKKNELIEQTLGNLKSTQAQLIQSEKMASLGELTAGIAHEIQNPLNFVNNFSEVNKELIEELRIKNEELKIEDEEINELLNDLADNSEKINHHGKRADAIVRGMLQHSKKTSGQKEPTDINALADEYLSLAFHGMRAKDKDFNATLNTDFDESIGNINIIPQDISRVLLNLYNNAFYAVNEKQKTYKVSKDLIGLEVYESTVSVSTKKTVNSVTVTVSDNGNGIPQNIVDKIFQPFFTTKPTGQGTGLGLSLSYDIMKAQGGEIKVDSKEGEGTTFIIQLPAASYI